MSQFPHIVEIKNNPPIDIRKNCQRLLAEALWQWQVQAQSVKGWTQADLIPKLSFCKVSFLALFWETASTGCIPPKTKLGKENWLWSQAVMSVNSGITLHLYHTINTPYIINLQYRLKASWKNGEFHFEKKHYGKWKDHQRY